MQGYLRVAREAAEHRQMSREPGTIVLDARSREKYDELHVEGALNLPFPDIAIEKPEARDPG